MATETKVSSSNYSLILARPTWAIIGPLALLSFLVPLARTPGWFTAVDAGYLFTALLMVAGRYLELRSGDGTTIYGDPMTLRNFRGYVLQLAMATLLLWLGVKLGSGAVTPRVGGP